MQDDGEDLGIFNDEWATSAHMELKSLNRLELEFLTAIVSLTVKRHNKHFMETFNSWLIIFL